MITEQRTVRAGRSANDDWSRYESRSVANPMVEQQFRDGQLKPRPMHCHGGGHEVTYAEFEERLECFQVVMASGRAASMPARAVSSLEGSVRELVHGHCEMLETYLLSGHRMCRNLYKAIYGREMQG